MIVLHSFIVDKDYSQLEKGMDIENIRPISEYKIPDSFYGGAVTHIAKLRNESVYLLLDMETDGIQVKDVAVENLEDLDFKILKEIATNRNLKFKPIGTSKEELIEKIKKVTLVLN
jgi:hypothetical protein